MCGRTGLRFCALPAVLNTSTTQELTKLRVTHIVGIVGEPNTRRLHAHSLHVLQCGQDQLDGRRITFGGLRPKTPNHGAEYSHPDDPVSVADADQAIGLLTQLALGGKALLLSRPADNNSWASKFLTRPASSALRQPRMVVCKLEAFPFAPTNASMFGNLRTTCAAAAS